MNNQDSHYERGTEREQVTTILTTSKEKSPLRKRVLLG
jgi:hypothetical protein